MFCQKCGAPMDSDAAFCLHCGAPANANPAPARTFLHTPDPLPTQPQQNIPTPSYQQSVPAPGYQQSVPAPGYQQSVPAPGYQQSVPAPGYQQSVPAPGYQQAPVYHYNPNPGYAPAAVKAPMNPAKKKKIILFSAIGGAAVILAVVLVLIFIGGSAGFSSPTDAAEAFVIAYGNQDVEGLVDCVPDFIVRELAYSLDLDINASRSDVIKYGKLRMPGLEDKVRVYGSYIVEYKDPDDYRRLNNSYYDYLYAYERAQITEVAIVEVTATYEGEYDTVEVVCIKMDGRWYAIDTD